MALQRLFSGIQPSGPVGLGNYLGAIMHWKTMQSDFECLFCIVDLHTLTVSQDPQILTKRCYDLLALYLSCGLDPKHHHLFFQSQRPEHAQLAWVLSCVTHMGELNRMTQFKDKSTQHGANAGLFTYPILMAADILLYDTQAVPVGADQKQHLELARDLATRFNQRYGPCFTVPEPYIPPEGARIMSLQDPTKKMSKSDDNVGNYITLLDEPKVIEKKIKRAVTDSQAYVAYDVSRPGISNLVTIYALLTGKDYESIATEYHGQGYGVFKQAVADCLIAELAPIQAEYHAIRQDLSLLKKISETGAQQVGVYAQTKMKHVTEQLGLIGH